MTEKNYGGDTGVSSGKGILKARDELSNLDLNKKKNKKETINKSLSSNKDKIIKAGKVASEVKNYAKSIIKKDIPLLEIAEKIEDRIIKLGAKPAFPVNLSINEIAAHYTPSYNDEARANGLLKVDIGVQVDGLIADTAFSIDLENSEENKKLIHSSQEALKNAIEKIKQKNAKTTLGEIGKTIQNAIEAEEFTPIINLSGHSMNEYDLHSGITIPNINTNQEIEIKEGLFAIEPFATLQSGSGKIYDGKPSGIYLLQNNKMPRSQTAREILDFIDNEYQTLPFCSRWLVKKFQGKALIALKELENNGNLHHFTQLVESTKSKVSQAEETIFIDKEDVIVTTE